jgi:hypothetical protein
MRGRLYFKEVKDGVVGGAFMTANPVRLLWHTLKRNSRGFYPAKVV